MTRWRDAVTDPPPLCDDYYATHTSAHVLTWDGRKVWLGYLQVSNYDDGEPPEHRWKEAGRDGYDLDGVTHWTELPPPPLDPIKAREALLEAGYQLPEGPTT